LLRSLPHQFIDQLVWLNLIGTKARRAQLSLLGSQTLPS
jgi:hypothetical protein